MWVDRTKFLALTTAMAAACASNNPAPAPLPTPNATGPDDAGAAASNDVDAGTAPGSSDAGARARATPDGGCDDTSATVASCNFHNPCDEAGDIPAMCRAYSKGLKPRAAAKIVQCLRSTTDTSKICDSDFQTACVRQGYAAACQDDERYFGKCQKIVADCKKTLKASGRGGAISAEECVQMLSAAKAGTQRLVSACLTESCEAEGVESCVFMRFQR
jgi:hypothetical protein